MSPLGSSPRRRLAGLVFAAVSLVPMSAEAGEPTTATTAGLPGTTLEADQRDDGTTDAAPWIIGSGLAAAAAIAVGGTVLKRRAAG